MQKTSIAVGFPIGIIRPTYKRERDQCLWDLSLFVEDRHRWGWGILDNLCPSCLVVFLADLVQLLDDGEDEDSGNEADACQNAPDSHEV